MLASFRNMFRVADLRNKVLFTLLVIAIYQVGTNVPIPGIDFQKIESITSAQKSNGVLGYLSLFAGTGLSKAAVLGLGIMPYITASIIIQLLSGVIPKFEQWRDQGAVGQKKLTQATRYLTVGLALMQSSGIVFLYHSGRAVLEPDGVPSGPDPQLLGPTGAVHDPRPDRRELPLSCGSGRTSPSAASATVCRCSSSRTSSRRSRSTASSQGRQGLVRARCDRLVVLLRCSSPIVFVEQGQRPIPVTFAKRVQGRRMYGGQSTYIPLKVNQAGVIPIIFASSLLVHPGAAVERPAVDVAAATGCSTTC